MLAPVGGFVDFIFQVNFKGNIFLSYPKSMSLKHHCNTFVVLIHNQKQFKNMNTKLVGNIHIVK